jgi:hypothetical protein
MLIHLAAATLNREAEGLGVVGRVAATYSRGGADITSHDWVIGSELTLMCWQGQLRFWLTVTWQR